MNTSPLDQFEIRDLMSLDAPILGNIHLSITNIGLYLTIGAFLAFSLNILASHKRIISNN
jgi:F-type H+-transporting ATPase subunit a